MNGKPEYQTIPEEFRGNLERLGYRLITGADQAIFRPYYEEMNGHWSAEASFLTVMGWGNAYVTFYKKAGELMIALEYSLIDETLRAYPFLGRYTPERVETAFRILREDTRSLRLPVIVIGASEWMLPFYQGLNGITWEISSQRESSDYVYKREDFAASMERSHVRYRYGYFVRRFEPETVTLTAAHREECLNCLREVWCEKHGCASCHLGCLADAAGRTIEFIEQLDADGILVRVNGKAVGFCITSCCGGLGIIHFKNADNYKRGLNDYLFRESYERFLGGADEINYTEDMGIEGLRTYKSKLAPYTLVPRFILREQE